MSTFSPNLRLENINTGTQAGAWGNTTNTNICTLLEDAVCGYDEVSVTLANQAFTALNGAADQSRNAIIRLTTTLTAAFNVYAPPVSKQYTIFNSSSYAATIYNNSGTLSVPAIAGAGVVIPAGKTMTVWSNGTNFLQQNTHLIAPTLDAPAMTGIPTAPTAVSATNTTQVATTAFVQAIAVLTINALYPVGTIYTATVATNPATLLGFGTWSAYGGGQCLVGYLSGSALPFGTGGLTGGSANSVVVDHTHTATTTLSNTTHTHSGTTASSGSHNHYIAVNTVDGADVSTNPNQPIVRQKSSAGDSDYDMRANIGGTANCGLTNTVAAHTHTITTGNNSATPTAGTTITNAGVTGVNANYQPYITVYMWRRDS